MIKISAVLIAKNEENNICYCLETVKWCAEIIVVDMASEDRTAEIARQYTNAIYQHPQVLTFDIAKKFAVEKSTGDWILLIDADEMIPSTLANTLEDLSRRNAADIIEIPFKHYIMGEWVRHSGWGYTPLPRFFKRGKIIFTEAIHNYMHMMPDARVMRLDYNDDNCIIHFNYLDSTHFVEKLNRYTCIEAQHLYEKRSSFSTHKLIVAAFREFLTRFFYRRGYKDGVRGFSLSLMMSFYRALSYIKLWEKYQFQNDPVSKRYERMRQQLISNWSKKKM